jgi:hypothetical protein
MVQSADSHGASHDSIVTLSAELNTALAYYQNATILAAQNNTAAASNYSTLSINVSGNVTMEAGTLDQTARNQLIVRNEIAYGTAFTAAVVSAAAVVEADRIRRLLRRRKSVTIDSESG